MSAAFAFASCSSSRRTISAFPVDDAKCNGVLPSLSAMSMLTSYSSDQYLLRCGEGRTGVGGERGIVLMRDVEGQGIRQMRSSGKGQASSIIWHMIPAERASRNTPGSHLHAFRRRGRRSWAKPSSVCMTWPRPRSRSGSTAGISMSVLVFSVLGAASPGLLGLCLHAFNFVNCSISGPPIRPVPKSDDQLALPNFPVVPLQCVFGKLDGRYRRYKTLDGHNKGSHGCWLRISMEEFEKTTGRNDIPRRTLKRPTFLVGVL